MYRHSICVCELVNIRAYKHTAPINTVLIHCGQNKHILNTGHKTRNIIA